MNYSTTENICTDCGKHFILRASDREYFESRSWNVPTRCKACRKRLRKEREEKQEAIANAKWQEEKRKKQEQFESVFSGWPQVELHDIKADNALFILGNGFDMMHGVNSSYYSFRDSLGKNSSLRTNLETFITVDDIWADFEVALGHMNMEFFSSDFHIDDALDMMGAFDEDAGAAEFFLGIDTATQIVQDIVGDLQRRFYNWVCQLTIGTDDRPLQGLFDQAIHSTDDGAEKGRGCYVLNFNYTEFAEDLYGVENKSICYIHGCRKKNKGHKRPKLILGHKPGANDNYGSSYKRKKRRTYRSAMVDAASEFVIKNLSDIDTEITKDCDLIIANHRGFFDSVDSVDQVITIGHSLSAVDWPYFHELTSHLKDGVHWYFGVHGLRDLENLERMLDTFNINRGSCSIFRTDKIRVKTYERVSITPAVQHAKKRCVSPDDRWGVQTLGNTIQIVDNQTKSIVYDTEFPGNISALFFLDDRLFLDSNDYPSGIYVFEKGSDGVQEWHYSFELQKPTERNLVNNSFCRVMSTEDKLTSVYNNRVIEFSLKNGSVIRNIALRGARNNQYPGKDVSELFLRRYR